MKTARAVHVLLSKRPRRYSTTLLKNIRNTTPLPPLGRATLSLELNSTVATYGSCASLALLQSCQPRAPLSTHSLRQDLNFLIASFERTACNYPRSDPRPNCSQTGRSFCTAQILERSICSYGYITAPGPLLCRLRNPCQRERLLSFKRAIRTLSLD